MLDHGRAAPSQYRQQTSKLHKNKPQESLATAPYEVLASKHKLKYNYF